MRYPKGVRTKLNCAEMYLYEEWVDIGVVSQTEKDCLLLPFYLMKSFALVPKLLSLMLLK